MARPPSANSILKNMKPSVPNPQAEIAGNFVLPNNSGEHVKGLKREAPIEDIDLVNKKYVDTAIADYVTLIDDSMADTLHRHSELSASDGAPNPAFSVDATGIMTGEGSITAGPVGGQTRIGNTINAAGAEGVSLNHDGTEAFLSSVHSGVAWQDLTVRALDFKVSINGSGTDFIVNNSGYVGVNKSAPAVNLDVVGTAANTDERFDVRIDSQCNNGIDGGLELRGLQPRFCMTDKSTGADWIDMRMNTEHLIFGGGDKTDLFTRVVDNILVLESDTGNVGIGTATPASILQVGSYTKTTDNELGIITDSGYNSTIRMGEATSNYGFTIKYDGGDTNDLYFTRHENSAAGDVAMAIDRSTGNVGIGTTSPTKALSVEDTLATFPIVRVVNKSATGFSGICYQADTGSQGVNFGYSNILDEAVMSLDSAIEYRIQIGGAHHFYIDTNGNVSIGPGDTGAISPDAKLEVDQSSTTGAIPVLTLKQADVSEGTINFVASDRGVIAAATASLKSVRVELNGTVYRLPLYVDA